MRKRKSTLCPTDRTVKETRQRYFAKRKNSKRLKDERRILANNERMANVHTQGEFSTPVEKKRSSHNEESFI